MAVVALLSIQLHISDARSLKDKRTVLRSLKDRLRKRNLAVAEVDHHDRWQRSELAVVAVGHEQTHVEQLLTTARDDVERLAPGMVVASQLEWLT